MKWLIYHRDGESPSAKAKSIDEALTQVKRAMGWRCNDVVVALIRDGVFYVIRAAD